MDKCQKCTYKIPLGNLFVCPNCGVKMCGNCAVNSQMICPFCYSSLELKG